MLSKLRGNKNATEKPVNGGSVTAQEIQPPETDLVVSTEFGWSLEVRRESNLVGTMHGNNPLSLISYFRDYTVLCGDPMSGYEVVLMHNPTQRSSVLGYHRGEEHWKSFLRELDPELDEASFELRNGSSRTSMTDPQGHALNADAVFEEVFGLA